MTIEEIAYKINELVSNNNHEFSEIQNVRRKNGINPNTWKPFAVYSIKDKYAFHAGGRKELQFNIAQDSLNNANVFRYGVAFPLNEDRAHNTK